MDPYYFIEASGILKFEPGQDQEEEPMEYCDFDPGGNWEVNYSGKDGVIKVMNESYKRIYFNNTEGLLYCFNEVSVDPIKKFKILIQEVLEK